MSGKKEPLSYFAAPAFAEENTTTTCYDKCIVHILREPMRRGGRSIGRTTGAKVVKIERAAMPASPVIISRLNAANDHQNATDAGCPVITWYFPTGHVQEHDVFSATDIYHPEDDMVITGLHIDTENKAG